MLTTPVIKLQKIRAPVPNANAAFRRCNRSAGSINNAYPGRHRLAWVLRIGAPVVYLHTMHIQESTFASASVGPSTLTAALQVIEIKRNPSSQNVPQATLFFARFLFFQLDLVTVGPPRLLADLQFVFRNETFGPIFAKPSLLGIALTCRLAVRRLERNIGAHLS
jgi:hypothetical protein